MKMFQGRKRLFKTCYMIAKLICCVSILMILKRLYIMAVGYTPARPAEPYNTVYGQYLVKYNVTHWKPAPVKTILVWTPYFGEWGWEIRAGDSMTKCPARCTYTRNKAIVGEADAVLFNANDMWKYRTLIGTLFEFKIPMPEVRTPDQVWILLSIEPMNTMRVSMNQYKFNWTTLHRRESTVYYPFTSWFKKSPDDITQNQKNFDAPQNYFKSKSKFAAAMISNCDDEARRYKIIRELKRYVEVDEFGDCSGNVICSYRKSPNECKELYDYKFYLAFDNSFCRDYISEKFWLTFDRGQIPIIAAPKYNLEMLPANSYLNVFDFESIEALAQRMIEVASNETLYNSYFDWMKMYKRDQRSVYCKLCRELHSNRTAQSYIDLDGWINDDICSKQTLGSSISALFERWLFDIGLI